MRIAFFGSRGIPACYSGFETCVEQLATRLAARGHRVTVYNRTPFNPYREREYQQVEIIRLPTLRTKITDTIAHTALSVLHALAWRRHRYDIAYFCGVGNSLLSFAPRLRGARTLVNVDGADFARAKWGRLGRWWLRRSERWATRLADVVLADNPTIQERYRTEYGVQAVYIPYGANLVTQDPGREALAPWKLEPDAYLLYVSRLTPENAADLALRAYRRSGSQLPLVIVGDAPYQSQYIDALRADAAKSPGVILTGYQFGAAYQQLSYHARAFLMPAAIEATRPVLLDQMAFGNCVIVRDNPSNRLVVADAGLYFDHAQAEESLADQMARVSQDSALAATYADRARARVRDHYDWDAVTTRYEKLFEQMLGASAQASSVAQP